MLASQIVKKCAELWGSFSIYRGQRALKNRFGRLGFESERILLRRSKRVYIIITQRKFGQSPNHENSALLECCSALQKCQIGFWRPNALLCSGVIWYFLLGFFGQSLYLDVFSTSVLWFFISFLDNSSFFKNNYLVDKSLKINLDNIQIIPNFVVIQSSILFLCMHPYFKH